jgi:hypothetical protein
MMHDVLSLAGYLSIADSFSSHAIDSSVSAALVPELSSLSIYPKADARTLHDIEDMNHTRRHTHHLRFR